MPRLLGEVVRIEGVRIGIVARVAMDPRRGDGHHIVGLEAQLRAWQRVVARASAHHDAEGCRHPQGLHDDRLEARRAASCVSASQFFDI